MIFKSESILQSTLCLAHLMAMKQSHCYSNIQRPKNDFFWFHEFFIFWNVICFFFQNYLLQSDGCIKVVDLCYVAICVQMLFLFNLVNF